MLRKLSLPLRLAALVAGTTLPLILFTGIIVYQHYVQDREAAFDRVLEVTRGIRLVLDREMQGIVSGLTVLANARSLAQDDFEGFRKSVDAFLKQFPDEPSIIIGDAEGQQIFNSRLPSGAALPQRTARTERDEVFRTGKPAFSQLFFGSVSQKPIMTVTVPVMRAGKVVYDLSFDPPIGIFQRIVEQQKPSDDWTISIFDQTGVNFARVPDPDQTIGKRASPTLYAVMFTVPEAKARTVSLEGVALLTAFSRSDLSGWIVAGGISQRTLVAPVLRSLILTAAIGSIMLLIGLAFAIRMATRIAHAEALHGLLINELNHRVKNTLSTIQSIAAQTFRNNPDTDARRKFDARLAALGQTHDVLSEEKWQGADIEEVIDGVLAPFLLTDIDRISKNGPSIRLSPRSAVLISLVLHELATNAGKYGALSGPNGRVTIDWSDAGTPTDQSIKLRWREIDGPKVETPARKGFGSTLIERAFGEQSNGSATLLFEPTGVVCTLECPAQ